MKCFISLLVAVFSVTSVYCADMKITVLYESKCPDTVRFFKSQFDTVYTVKNLSEKIEFEMVPYGHATQTKTDGKWKFTCQHGNDECYGNKVQACALDMNSTAAFNFITCAMKSADASVVDNLQPCATKSNLDWNAVSKCVNEKGDDLLAKMGNRTKELAPENKIESLFIPTIIFNNKYDQRLQNLALKDFVDVTQLELDYVKGGSEKLAPFGLAIFFVALFQYFA